MGARRPARPGHGLALRAFFAAFGQPGPKIRAWLDDVDFMHAASANFWSPAAVMPRWYKSMWDGVEHAAFDDRLRAYMDRMLGYPSGRTNAAVIRCASGQANECPDVVMAGSLPPDQAREPIERGLPQPRNWYYEFGYVGDRSYRDFRPRLLADMVRDVGVDRFRKIWTSQRKINEAYAEATGTPFETAMADYVRRSVGGGASLGPSLPARPAVSAMIIVLVLLIGVAGRVVRREHR